VRFILLLWLSYIRVDCVMSPYCYMCYINVSGDRHLKSLAGHLGEGSVRFREITTQIAKLSCCLDTIKNWRIKNKGK